MRPAPRQKGGLPTTTRKAQKRSRSPWRQQERGPAKVCASASTRLPGTRIEADVKTRHIRSCHPVCRSQRAGAFHIGASRSGVTQREVGLRLHEPCFGILRVMFHEQGKITERIGPA